MWKNLSYKKRFISVTLGFLAILILGYFLAIRKTVSVYLENKSLERLTRTDENDLVLDLASANQQKSMIDSLINLREKSATISGLVSSIFQLAESHDLMVATISDSEQTTLEEELYLFRFSGLFINMTKFLRAAEQELTSVHIASVEIVKNADRRTNETRLFLNLTLRRPNYER